MRTLGPAGILVRCYATDRLFDLVADRAASPAKGHRYQRRIDAACVADLEIEATFKSGQTACTRRTKRERADVGKEKREKGWGCL